MKKKWLTFFTSLDEIAKWNPKRIPNGRVYMEEYYRLVPKSAPEEDWEDRIKLYAM
jgi:hypothetical protein